MADDTEGRQEADSRPVFKGRPRIFSDAASIDAGNVAEVLSKALPWHMAHKVQVNYLWRYYKGIQPVLQRVKDVRPEINNRIVENHAQEIVAFKIGYQLAEPLQYTCRTYDTEGSGEGGDNPRLGAVNELNTLMFAEDKASADRDLFEWMCVCGVGYRMCLADEGYDEEDGGAPFEVFTLDPRHTFTVRSSAYHHRPLMAVYETVTDDGARRIYNCWTDKSLYIVEDNKVVSETPHTYGRIPIIEYQLNNARMGVFEPVLCLLDAINTVESNRIDGIEQTVQALMKFVNCSVDETLFKEMLQLGAVEVTTTEGAIGPADVDIIKNDLNQSSTQVTKDDLYQSIVNICGMPSRSGKGASTSDTGAAVMLRDGWTLAESHAKSYELQFKRSERDFLRVALAICEQAGAGVNLRIRDIELAFNRRNYENVLVKSQVLTTMLSTPQVHPELAFQSCGLFTDPEAAYMQSRKWAEEHESRAIAAQQPSEPGNPGPQATVPQRGDGAPTASSGE